MTNALELFLNDIRRKCPKITAPELAAFAAGLSVETLPPKAVYRASDVVPDKIAFIAEGLLKGYYINPQGDQINTFFGTAGLFIGDYLAFVQQLPSRYAIAAIEPAVVVNLPFAHFQQSLDTVPALERYFRLVSQEGYIRYAKRTEGFIFGNAQSRYEHFVAEYPDLFRRISVSDLSSYLGVQRQTLTRIRKKLLENSRPSK